MTDFTLFLFRKLCQLFVGSVADKLIAQCNVVINTVIHIRYPRVVGIPAEVGEAGHVVTGQPGRGYFVRTAFLQVEEATHVVLSAVAAQIRITAFFLSGSYHCRIDFP